MRWGTFWVIVVILVILGTQAENQPTVVEDIRVHPQSVEAERNDTR